MKKSTIATIGGTILSLGLLAGFFGGNNAIGVKAASAKLTYYSLTPASTNTFGGGYTKSFTGKAYSNNDHSITWGGFGVNGGASWIRIGSGYNNNNLASLNADDTNYAGITTDHGGYMMTETAVPVSICEFSINLTSVAASFSNIHLEVSSAAYAAAANPAAVCSTQTDFVTKAAATGTLTFTPTSGDAWAANSYFRIIAEGNGTYTTKANAAYVATNAITFSYMAEETKPTSVSVALASNTLEGVAKTTTATATVLPADASDKTVIWSSSNEDVAIVDDKGVVTSIGSGTANIIATANADSTVKGSAVITVSGIPTPVDSDKRITSELLGYETTYSNVVSEVDGIVYGRVDVQKAFANNGSGIQLKASTGCLFNRTAFPSPISKVVVTFSPEVANDPSNWAFYAGTSIKPETTPITGTNEARVYTFDLSSNSYTHFNIAKTGQYATYISSVVVELQGDSAVATRAWATDFLAKTSAVCVADGSTPSASLVSAWEGLSATYAALAESNASIIAASRAAVAGTEVEKALARYEYIAGKYSALSNFIGRDLSNSSMFIGFVNNAETAATLGVSVVAVIGLGTAGLFIAKKRKENN